MITSMFMKWKQIQIMTNGHVVIVNVYISHTQLDPTLHKGIHGSINPEHLAIPHIPL